MQPSSKKHYAVILGARPNFIKAAPFFRYAKHRPDLAFTIIHTGQHFDDNMSKIFFEQMNIPRPDVTLETPEGASSEKLGKLFSGLKNFMVQKKFDGVITFGDVNSTLAGALSAAKHGGKLLHIESGLRSHDRRMPEETNRVIVDHLSDLLFTSEPQANQNLIKEGIGQEKIKYVGNIMIEALELFSANIEASSVLRRLGLQPKKYVVATVHRQENTEAREGLKDILLLLSAVASEVPMIFPLHPGTRNKIVEYELIDLLAPLTVVEPLGYFDFLKLVSESRGVLTDSGGIQEETTHLGVPCATLRDNTERPITLTLGTNKLFANDLSQARTIIEHLSRVDFKSKSIPLWDANVSKRIFQWI